MKNKYKIVMLLLAVILFSFVNVSLSKYVFDVNEDVTVTTGAFYFESNATNVTVPISNPTFTIDVDNYLGALYTEGNINYKISISDGNGVHDDYNFSINGGAASANDYYTRTLTGNSQSKDTLTITLNKVVTNNLIEEPVYFTIEALGPYTKTITFTVTVINPPGFDVTGNATAWTQGPVTLTVVPTAGSISEYSFDDGATWQSSASKTYTQNENGIKIKVKDQYGNETNSVTIDITYIDTTAPTIQTDNGRVITTLGENMPIANLITATDSQSGVSAAGVTAERGGNPLTNTNTFTRPGLYAVTLSASDNVGNQTTMNAEILVRWPTGGRYVVKKTELDGAGIVATGHSSSTSNDGLYRDNADTGGDSSIPFASKYYYAGPSVDNYISFAGTTFRILNVATNDTIKVIGEVSDVKTAWGNRKIYDSNVFNTWSTKWWPRGQIYNNETGESRYQVFTETEKAHLALATFYAGRFTKSNANNIANTVYYEQNGSVNLGSSTNDAAFQGYSAYPNVSDYLKACKAHNIITNIDDSQSTSILGIGQNNRQIFRNNSWIGMTVDQWTMNSKNATSTDNDFWVVETTTGSQIMSRTYYYNQQYRVVFYITDTTILSGSGTSADPFKVEEDWAWFDNAQVLQ